MTVTQEISEESCAVLAPLVVPPCAVGCPLLVQALIDLTRLHGISEAAERSNHGLPPP